MSTWGGVIWDLDGVIVDSARWHFDAWREVSRRHGRSMSETEFRAGFGQRNEEIIQTFFGIAPDDPRSVSLAEEKESLFRAAVAGQARPLPGAAALLEALHQAGYAQAIGSSAPRANVEFITEALGLTGYFDSMVCAEDVAHGKPDPEIFRRAAERLALLPAQCVVIEDAVAGVTAAKGAGMACIAVTNTCDRRSLLAADMVLGSLEAVDVAMISRLLGHRGQEMVR